MPVVYPIKRILIANRGEIARRIIRSCSSMGIESVAVYTDPDRYAPHVREATHAVCLGNPTAYLSIDSIVDAAVTSGADAVHPGYGFLSENPALPEALTKAGIRFIGPSAETIRKLGSKTAAKELAHAASVAVSPTLLLDTSKGIAGEIEQIEAFGRSVGLPIILKAAAGGGGRGQRIIREGSDIKSELESARREGLRAFGSEEIFAEKYIAPARHIEVQIAGDSAGTAIALGTRDCSLQRNNQKIIEEAPAPNLPGNTERDICAAAARLAHAAGYSSLGTVEFLYAPDGAFYFLEVNTRLQVEHPVTEAVTGVDLVALQIRLARGETLAECGIHTQPIPNGHAIEARLCAEEFTDSFILSTGTITELALPELPLPGTSLRNDMGVTVCSEVSHHYDSLIGKVIVHGSSREEAIAGLLHALAHTRVSGVKTNRALLMHLLSTPEFHAVNHSIQGTKDLFPSTNDTQLSLVIAHAVAAAIRASTSNSTWANSSPWHDVSLAQPLIYPWSTTSSGMSLSSNTIRVGSLVTVSITTPHETERLSLRVQAMRNLTPSTVTAQVSLDGSLPSDVTVTTERDTLWVHLPHGTWALQPHTPKRGGAAADSARGGAEVTAHIPGRVAAVHVTAGDDVKEGTTVIVLDSMKMEHPIRAPFDGKISAIEVSPDQVVQSGAVLIVIDVLKGSES
jgi:acetyl/propionyl-CoA carboxylase alpha subunit